MFNDGSSPTVTNCTFVANSADLGAGMFNQDSSPTVVNCTFTGNGADGPDFSWGGGMYNMGGSPAVTSCAFVSNFVNLGGGGVWNQNSNPTVADCTFTGNTAVAGAGMVNGGGSTSTVTNCTFQFNSSTLWSGGMHNQSPQTNPTVSNCTFIGNTANGTGGGMMIGGSGDATVINCTFEGNSGATAGGIYVTPENSTITVKNCILWNNGSNEFFGPGTVRYCNVQGGWAGTGNINADPMFVDPDNGALGLQPESPCIDAGDNDAVPMDITTDLDGNPRFLEIPETPDTGNGTLPIVDMGAYEALGAGCLAVTGQEVVCNANGTMFTVNVEGLNACTGGTTQVTFTGSGGAVGEELCFTAVVNDGGFCCTTEICVTIPDCTPVPQASDLDGDGTVGIADFLALLAAWGVCSDCGDCPADFDGDCSVGILDLLILLGNWG